MRLLNIKTLRLEWFHSADDAPSYVILSHRWEDEEVLFEDVEERPEARKLRTLQMKLEETERRLEALSSRFEGATQTIDDSDRMESDFTNIESGNHSSTSSTPKQPAHVRESQERKPKAWAKVLGCCRVAELQGISYVWIDTCCIDKNSSSELSESINSMFAWYRKASICIAYLSDVTQAGGNKFERRRRPENSDWFSRGWTLQELIAPEDVWFFDSNWKCIGIRSELVDELSKITGIEEELLRCNGVERLYSCSVAARMSWAARRKTTRPEDRAYSLLGIFGVNMPILYGEGEQNAFFRLQVTIFQTVSDHSIFAWQATALELDSRTRFFGDNFGDVGLFAPSPICFKRQGMIGCLKPEYQEHQSESKPVTAHSMCVQLLLRPLGREEDFFQENEARFETLLGSFDSKENKKQAVSMILIQTGPAKYRRLVGRHSHPRGYGVKIQDLQVTNFYETSYRSANWSIRDVFITNPRPSLPLTPTKFIISGRELRMSLNCITALRGGLEVGGFWGAGAIKFDDVSTGKAYTAFFRTSRPLQGLPPYFALAFTVRSVVSGEICGLIISFRFYEWFAASIVHDLDEEDFKQGTFFDPTLYREYGQEIENLRRGSLFGWKLRDDSNLFLNIEMQGRETAELKVGIMP